MYMSLPVFAGAILLVGLAHVLIPKTLQLRGAFPVDMFLGSGFGSVLAGNPLTSYILGGAMLEEGVSLVAVTSFLVAWVTVGLVQLPAEAIMLGRRFAVWRNVLSFAFSIVVALFTSGVLRVI